jgi:hypothetical protein
VDKRLPFVVFLLVVFGALVWGPGSPAEARPGAKATTIIILPTPTRTPTQLIIIAPPTATRTQPSSSVQTRTPTPTVTRTQTASPTLPSFAFPTSTPTYESFVGEKPPSPTPHGDPYYPDFPLTLPSPTPTQVTFKGPDVPDLYITDFEITQGMQNLENEMPLVQDRRTMARVYVCTDGGDWPDVRGGIQAWRNGAALAPAAGEPLGKALLPANGPITAHASCGDRLNIDDSLYFYLPSHWRSGEVTLRAFVYATDPQAPFLYEESDTNNFKTVYDLEFSPAQAAVFRLIPLHLHEGYDKDNPSATYFPTEITFGLMGGWDIAYDVFRLHPIAEMYIELSGDVSSPTAHGLGNEWHLDSENESSDVLDRLEWERYWADDPPWYVGMVSAQFDDSAAYNGLARGDKDVAWAIMNPEHWPVTQWHVEGGGTLAHELAHLAGLDHAPCADNDGDGEPDEAGGGPIDDDFPTGFPHCSLAPVDKEGFYGTDLYWNLWPFTSGPTVISNDPAASSPHRGFPLMGYRNPNYIDAYAYCLLLDYYGVNCNPDWLDLGPQGGGGGGVGPHADCDTHDNPFPGPLVNWELCLTDEGEPELYRPSTWESVIAISGQVDPQAGTAEIGSVTVIHEPPESLIAEMAERSDLWLQDGGTSPYLLSFETAAGTPLVFVPILDTTTHHAPPGKILFSEVLPYVDLPEGVNGLVRVRSNPRALEDLGETLAERRSSDSPPTVELLPAPGGSVVPPFEIRWTASDADGDELSFTLLYSRDLGETWIWVASDLTGDAYPIGEEISLPGSAHGLFRVIAGDGFDTAFDDSEPVYVLPDRPPFPLIFSPAERLVLPLGEVAFLSGSATDAEDGALPSESLAWSSDLDGPLGTGSELQLRDLSPGLHTLSLAATDRIGQTATATVHFAIDPAVVRWRASPDEQAALDAVLSAAGGPAEPAETPPRPKYAVLAIVAGLLLLGVAGAGLVAFGLRRRSRGH